MIAIRIPSISSYEIKQFIDTEVAVSWEQSMAWHGVRWRRNGSI
jgi:hypothetical protein